MRKKEIPFALPSVWNLFSTSSDTVFYLQLFHHARQYIGQLWGVLSRRQRPDSVCPSWFHESLMGYALPQPHIALMIGTNVFPLSDSVYLTFGGTCGYSLRIGSTNKFSTAILAHLFCPLFALDPPHSFGYASGLPPQSDEKIYANLRGYFISDSYNQSEICDAHESIPLFRFDFLQYR